MVRISKNVYECRVLKSRLDLGFRLKIPKNEESETDFLFREHFISPLL